MADTLAGVKPGDLIAADGFGREVSIYKVIKVTATQAVTATGTRFRIDNGKRIGAEGFSHRHGRFADEQDIMRARVLSASRRLRDFQVSPENVAAVESLLDPTGGGDRGGAGG